MLVDASFNFMDIFNFRNQLIGDYKQYISSFINIRDQRIKAFVDEKLSNGVLWPEPLIRLNPAFEPGEGIPELIKSGRLHPETERIFRANKSPSSSGTLLRLHKHQADAVDIAGGGNNYVLTTGTGSGKSLAYMVPRKVSREVGQSGPII